MRKLKKHVEKEIKNPSGCNLKGSEENSFNHLIKQATGVGPASSAWEADIIAVIRRLHI